MSNNALVLQLRALGEPTRLDLATRLAEREWGGTELLGALNISQPSLSRHLKVLREAGVVRERRDGRNVYYQLAPEGLPRLVVDQALGKGLEDMGKGARRPQKMSKGEYVDLNVLQAERLEAPGESDPGAGERMEDWML